MSRVLKKRGEHLTPLGSRQPIFWDETVRHPTRRDLARRSFVTRWFGRLRATAFSRREFGEFSGKASEGYQISSASCRICRLRREQNLASFGMRRARHHDIADEAGLSLETVKRHLHSIFCKLECPVAAEMALTR